MNSENPQPPAPRWHVLLLRLWMGLARLVRPGEMQVTLIWAGLIGFGGALASVGFRKLIALVHGALTGQAAVLLENFAQLPWWQRLLVPALGGLLAGLTLCLRSRIDPGKSSTDYMEAIVLGDGVISSRVSLVKSASALFSIASGASIGREGPMVQLSAMIASLIGRVRRMPAVRLRLLVACGAAAGIASAYNAPIGGALFVSEIILRSLAMESFGPLVFASVVATLTIRQLLGASPLYEITVPAVQLHSNWEIALYLALGGLAGVIAPAFLWSLRAGERLFEKLPGPSYLRLAAGGAAVGAIAVALPQVCGNGYGVINEILQGHYLWQTLLIVLIFKWAATVATFGSGAVGGVFTPTLFVGAGVGTLFAAAAAPHWPGAPLVPSAFTLVGMGALLSATTHAPLMAILIVFEMTLDYQMILPLMLACVVAHYVSRRINPQSIYAESLRRKGEALFDSQLAAMRVADLMKPDPPRVPEAAPFREVAQQFVKHPLVNLYVVDENGAFLGAVSLHDIKGYLDNEALANLVIARDLLHADFPAVTPEVSFTEALAAFARHAAERLPVIASAGGRELIGSVSKNDLLLALAEQARQGEA